MYRLLMLLIVIDDVSGHAELMVTGAGATTPAGVYVTWMAGYMSSRAPFVDVRLAYHARGSGFGKRAIASRSVSYAGSDSLLSDDEYRQNPDLQMFPSIALYVGLSLCQLDSLAAVGISGSTSVSIRKLLYASVSTGTGDRCRVDKPSWYVTSHPGQHSLAVSLRPTMSASETEHKRTHHAMH